MKYYFAYGSNMNLDQMEYRCPKATIVGPVILPDYKLIFNGVASIQPATGHATKGLLWKLTEECEKSLDRYEGYPRLYRKEHVTVYDVAGKPYKAMVYIMNRDNPAMPSDSYLRCIYEGYMQNNIEPDTLFAALEETKRMIKGGASRGTRKTAKRQGPQGTSNVLY